MTKTAEKAPELFETKATDLKGDAAVNPITVKPKAEKKPKSQAVAKVEPAAPPAAAVPANFLQLLYQMAIDPRVDVEKMRAGLDMQERIEGSEARKAFTRAFNALQFDLPTIDKDGFIDHGEGLSKGGCPHQCRRISDACRRPRHAIELPARSRRRPRSQQRPSMGQLKQLRQTLQFDFAA